MYFSPLLRGARRSCTVAGRAATRRRARGTFPARTISTTTNLAGRVVTYVDVWGQTNTSTFDAVTGRLITNVGPTGSSGYTYDRAGRVTQQTHPRPLPARRPRRRRHRERLHLPHRPREHERPRRPHGVARWRMALRRRRLTLRQVVPEPVLQLETEPMERPQPVEAQTGSYGPCGGSVSVPRGVCGCGWGYGSRNVQRRPRGVRPFRWVRLWRGDVRSDGNDQRRFRRDVSKQPKREATRLQCSLWLRRRRLLCNPNRRS